MKNEADWGSIGSDPQFDTLGYDDYAVLAEPDPGDIIGVADWGTLGADHRVRADVTWSGDGFVPPVLGWSWNPIKAVKDTVRKVSRGAGNLVRDPVKFATRGVQNVAHTATTGARTVSHAAKVAGPYIAVGGAIGASLVCPAAAPLAVAALAASKLLAKAGQYVPKIPSAPHEHKAAKAKKAAMAVIRNTVKKAKAGDVDAKRAASILAATHKARKTAKAKKQKLAFVADRRGFAHRVA